MPDSIGYNRGDFVKAKQQINKYGVVEGKSNQEGFVFVCWLLTYCKEKEEIQDLIECVHVELELEPAPQEVHADPGLQMLREKVLR